MQLRNEPQL